jgi:hypothetical protein
MDNRRRWPGSFFAAKKTTSENKENDIMPYTKHQVNFVCGKILSFTINSSSIENNSR